MKNPVDVKSKYAEWFYLNALENLYFVKTGIDKKDLTKRIDDFLKFKLNKYNDSCTT
jgi:hypothetical protein